MVSVTQALWRHLGGLGHARLVCRVHTERVAGGAPHKHTTTLWGLRGHQLLLLMCLAHSSGEVYTPLVCVVRTRTPDTIGVCVCGFVGVKCGPSVQGGCYHEGRQQVLCSCVPCVYQAVEFSVVLHQQ